MPPHPDDAMTSDDQHQHQPLDYAAPAWPSAQAQAGLRPGARYTGVRPGNNGAAPAPGLVPGPEGSRSAAMGLGFGVGESPAPTVTQGQTAYGDPSTSFPTSALADPPFDHRHRHLTYGAPASVLTPQGHTHPLPHPHPHSHHHHTYSYPHLQVQTGPTSSNASTMSANGYTPAYIGQSTHVAPTQPFIPATPPSSSYQPIFHASPSPSAPYQALTPSYTTQAPFTPHAATLQGSSPSAASQTPSVTESPTAPRPGWNEFTFAPNLDPTAAAASDVASSSKRAPKRQRTIKGPKDKEKEKPPFTIPSTRRSPTKPAACTPCQNAKAKCEPVRGPGSGACQRCTKENITCVPAPGAKARPFPEKYYSEQLQRKQVYINLLTAASQKLRGQGKPGDATAPQDPALLSPLSPTGRRRLSQEGKKIVTWLTDSSNGTAASDSPISPTNGVEERSPSVPDAPVPLKLFSELALEDRHKGEAQSAPTSPERSRRIASKDDVVGILAQDYFQPGPSSNLIVRQELVNKGIPPELLLHDLLTSQDIGELFRIYHAYLNSWVPVLDPYLHTATETYRRSPFLWSVVCAVTLRYYPLKAHLYVLAMQFAKNHAAQTLMQLESTMYSDDRIVDRHKSVELVQAYVLLAIYSVPMRKWQEDRSWLYIGLALRIAVDLGVDRTKPDALKGSEVKDREVLNRMRLWMILWDADWNMSAYGGKPYGVKENRIMLNAPKFYHLSHYNLLHDVGLSAYSELFKLIGRFHSDVHSDPAAVGGLNSKLDIVGKVLEADGDLSSLYNHWKGVFAESRRSFLTGHDLVSYDFRALLWPFCVEYGRLWLLSFGFQQAFENDRIVSDKAPVLVGKCLSAGKEVVRLVNDEIIPKGFMNYSPDGYFLFTAYSASFLLKLLGPRYDPYLPVPEKEEIHTMVQTLVGHFSSKERFPDPRHTPRLYGRFLARVLERYRPLLPSDSNVKQEEPAAGPSAQYPPATLDFDFGMTDTMFDPSAQFNQDPYVFSALFPSFSSYELAAGEGTEAQTNWLDTPMELGQWNTNYQADLQGAVTGNPSFSWSDAFLNAGARP